MWQALGGQLDGQVHDGTVPSNATWRFNFDSPPLAEVVRDTNKYSNNLLAQHIFLTLGRQLNNRSTPTRWEDAQQALNRWWQQQFGSTAPEMGNGSGLGRDSKISATALAQLLQRAWNSGLMPDLAASLPVSGVDGTLRRSNLPAGQAHLKTGSLRDVQALAGYVHGSDGQRRIVVAIVNHPEARAAKPALEALVQWADRGGD
jgi:D-alanyl-D-alanine carboxypeptidase/D-alanyl-D-alanine-endopeptidase (penicillin-binding protein 4)